MCSNSQQYIAWVKMVDFSFMLKFKIRILCSIKIFFTFPTVNISKLNFVFVICIAKNFIWTTLKAIFSIFGGGRGGGLEAPLRSDTKVPLRPGMCDMNNTICRVRSLCRAPSPFTFIFIKSYILTPLVGFVVFVYFHNIWGRGHNKGGSCGLMVRESDS